MTVHSTQLVFASAHASATTTIYTVPSNTRTIVKHVAVHNHAAGANRVVVYGVKSGNFCALVDFALTASGAAGDTTDKIVWAVLNAGDSVAIFNSADTCDFWISGAELKT